MYLDLGAASCPREIVSKLTVKIDRLPATDFDLRSPFDGLLKPVRHYARVNRLPGRGEFAEGADLELLYAVMEDELYGTVIEVLDVGIRL